VNSRVSPSREYKNRSAWCLDCFAQETCNCIFMV
jgi:hypothetical protein